MVGCGGGERKVRGGRQGQQGLRGGGQRGRSPWLHFSHLTSRFSGLTASDWHTQQACSSPGTAAVGERKVGRRWRREQGLPPPQACPGRGTLSGRGAAGPVRGWQGAALEAHLG